jgi:SAM-dependent methyltransferase
VANEAQRENWNGESGRSWARRQDEFDANNATWGDLLAEVAGCRLGERVLDVGCGGGATTLAASRRVGPAGRATGVDLSELLLGVARERAAAAGLGNVAFHAADAQVDDLAALAGAAGGLRSGPGPAPGGPYDVAISRFGVMFFDDPVAAFANVRAAMAPDGRLAFVSWAPLDRQPWLVVPLAAVAPTLGSPDLDAAAPGMTSLGDPGRATEVLTGAGWSAVTVARHRRPMVVGGAATVAAAAEFLAGTGPLRALVGDADDATAARARQDIRRALEPHATPQGIVLSGEVLAVTARA